MDIEIQEFFPNPYDADKRIITGTLRIRLPADGICILGIYVSKKRNSYYFMLPGKNTRHCETMETIRYPFIVFDDQDKQRALMTALKEKAPAFIEDWLATHPQQKADIRLPEVKNNAPGPKQTALQRPTQVSKPAIIGKVWQDPPKRKISLQGKYAKR